MTNRRSSRREAEGSAEGTGHLAASFTDLMASLMVVFILLFVATVSNVAIKDQTVTEILLGALKAALSSGGLDAGGARQDPNDPSAVIIVMPEALLFQRGNWIVESRGAEYLGRMIPVLSSVVCGPDLRGQVGSVVVEGHTDTTWFAAKSPEDGAQANLELSQRRSMEVVKVGLATMPYGTTRDCFRRLLSASGRGQEELLPDVPEDDLRQRRVVFKIRTQRQSVAPVAEATGGVER